jgi:hypothetical protein
VVRIRTTKGLIRAEVRVDVACPKDSEVARDEVVAALEFITDQAMLALRDAPYVKESFINQRVSR